MKRLKTPILGLRLSDYNRILDRRPRLPSRPLLLKNRAKTHYKHQTQSQLEAATVISGVIKSGNIHALQLLRERAPFLDVVGTSEKLVKNRSKPDVFLEKLMREASIDAQELKKYVRCWESDSVEQALAIMGDDGPWPSFLLLWTFNRPIRTRNEAYLLIKLYEKHIAECPPSHQIELTWLALDIAQTMLIEYLTPVCRIFLRMSSHSLHRKPVFNDLLWKLARFGTFWSSADLEVIKSAQKILVDHFRSSNLDLKGYTALAYVAQFQSPELARRIIAAAPHEAPETEEMAYKHGRELIMLCTCTSFEEGLEQMTAIRKNDRSPMVWSAFLLGIVQSGYIDTDDELAVKLWNYWEREGLRISAYMTGQLVRKVRPFDRRKWLLRKWLSVSTVSAPEGHKRLKNGAGTVEYAEYVDTMAPADSMTLGDTITPATTDPRYYAAPDETPESDNAGDDVEITGRPHRLTPSLLTSLFSPVYTLEDYHEAKTLLYSLNIASEPACRNVLTAFLYMQSRWEPSAAWNTYKTILNHGDPPKDAIAWLCGAASNPQLEWDGIYAAQRAFREVKMWVQQHKNDQLKAFPSPALVHNYIVMLGRAGYQDELQQVLTWLHDIGFKANKMALCALIVYSEYGPTMRKLAVKGGDSWPSEHEVELYRVGKGLGSV